MKLSLVFGYLLVLLTSHQLQAQSWFPQHPDPVLTPGDLCQSTTEMRYPEKISYCERNVFGYEKWQVINSYMHKLPDLRIKSDNRYEFKIDHFIPLCMGGSNSPHNLWPQHHEVYKYTDNIEIKLCEEMAEGSLLQAEAIKQIKFAKYHLNEWKDLENPIQYIKANYNK